MRTDPLEALEALAFADDRHAALAGLPPGAEAHDYWRGVQLQQRGDLDAVDEILAAWEGRFGPNREPFRRLRRRQLLLRAGADPAAHADQLRIESGLELNDAPPAHDVASALPTRFDHVDEDALLRKMLGRAADGRFLTPVGLREVVARGLASSPAQARSVLARLDTGDVLGLVEAIARDLSERDAPRFGAHAAHRALDLAQLHQLAGLRESLRDEPAWVEAVLVRMRLARHEDPDDPAARRPWLEEVWRFVEPLGRPFNTLKAAVLGNLLGVHRRLGHLDRGLLVAWLSLPRNTNWIEWSRFAETRPAHQVGAGSSHEAATGLALPADEEALARALVEQVLATEDDADLRALLGRGWYEQRLATARLLAGAPDADRWGRMLGAEALAALRDRVDLELAPENPSRWGANDPVSLAVDIKGVEALTIKVFRVNSLAAWLATGADVDASLDLDGMVAARERVIRFDEPQLRRVRRRLEIPECDGPGTWVIELLGGGRASRALVRKGALRHTVRVGAAGVVLQARDEAGQVVRDAALWVGATQVTAREDGSLVVPFSTAPRAITGLLVRGDVATVVRFHQPAEEVALTLGVHLEREGMVAGKTARVLLRPTLTLAGWPAPLALIEAPRVTVTVTDRAGTTAARVYEPELRDDAETPIELQVPEEADALTVHLRGHVRIRSTGQRVVVEARADGAIDPLASTDAVEIARLTRAEDGWTLTVVGRTGEPRPRRAVSLSLRHVLAEAEITTSVATDDAGRVTIAAIPGLSSVRATLPSQRGQRFVFASPPAVPPRLQVASGDVVHLPGPAWDQPISVTELRGGAPRSRAPEAVRWVERAVAVGPLAPGTWRLRSAGWPHDVVVDVAPAGAGGWAWTPLEQLELSARPPVLASAAVEGDELVARVVGAGPSTRVHVFATRWLSDPLLGASLDAGSRPPTAVPRPDPRSAYLSGRDIGDEYRYVLDRRTRRRRPGTLLERPGLLLNPWAVRTTTTGTQHAKGAGAWAGAGAPAPAAPPAPRPQAREDRAAGDLPGGFVDALPDASRCVPNLRPDADGRVRVPLAALGYAAQVHVVAVDPALVSRLDVVLPERALPTRDRRLRSPLDAGLHLAEERRVDGVPGGRTVSVEARSGKVELVDTLERAHGVLGALGAPSDVASFAWLMRWPDLSEADQRARYSEHACHELHLFLYFRDRPFFDAVVAPYLANKHAPTFVDRWLLGGDLSPWRDPWRFGRLNALERALLGRRLPDLAPVVARLLGDEVARSRPDPERDDRLVGALLGASALSGGAAVAPEEAESMLELDEAPMSSTRAAKAKRRGPPAPASAPPPGGPAGIGGGGNADFAADMFAREESAPWFRQVEKTREWAEHDWWHVRAADAGPELIGANRFWRDFAAHNQGPFLSPHLGECTRTFAEALCALAVLDLPFRAGAHAVTRDEDAVRIALGSPSLVASTQLAQIAPTEGAPPILVGQSLLRADDRTVRVDGEEREKYVEGPLLVGVVYVCRVVVTNPTPGSERVSVLAQIPEGSVSLSGFVTRTFHLGLSPYATVTLEYSFTFPFPGSFRHYPAQVAKGRALRAAAPAATWEVRATPPAPDPENWAHVAAHGTTEDVARQLRERDPATLDLGLVAWRMREPEAFAAVTGALADRGVYDDALWAYALRHRDAPRMREWLRQQAPFLAEAGPVLEGGLVDVDPVERGLFEHLEYAPLVNARAHPLGAAATIPNDGLAAQVRAFLEVVAHRRRPTADDQLVWAHYLLCQDRTDEASASLARAPRDAVRAKLQHDWVSAYAAVSEGEFARARALASRWVDHPVDRWRDRFHAIVALLDEVDGRGRAAPVDPNRRDAQVAERAARAPALELALEGAGLVVHHVGLPEVEVRVYGVDLELLFSRQPFVQGDVSRFGWIEPLHQWTVALDGDGRTGMPIPEASPTGARLGNVVVEVVGAGLRRAVARWRCDLVVQVAEPWGQLTVLQAATRAPAPATYVKVYGRRPGGEVRFYKDGYTDPVGRFDYAGLSTDDLDHVERFAILVASDAHGATVLEASPPPR